MKNIIKNTNKKGFTIVELVIVIAVIAILAGVLIPTFSSIITKANESAALQEATNAYKEAYADALIAGKGTISVTKLEIDYNGKTYTFTLENGVLKDGNDTVSVTLNTVPVTDYTYTVTKGVITAATKK